MREIANYVCDNSQRLDKFLSSQIGQTRSQITQLVKQECIYVDNINVNKPGLKLKLGQIIKVEFPKLKKNPPQEIDFLKEGEDIEILFEDDDLLVINKPSGVTVHPAPSVKEATLVDWLKHKGISLSTISGEERHGIVHRLDKGTSGAMVIAKNNESHEFLSKQLQDKSMGRYYLAVINPPLKDDITIVDKSIKRSHNNRLKMACLEDGKTAKTMFKSLLLSNDEKKQLIACKLFTGRTHQIRVHLESISRHIVGDHIYANSQKQDKSERILLHAYIIYFTHPRTKEQLSFCAGLDEVFKTFLEKKFNTEKINEIIDTKCILHGFTAAS